MKDPQFRRSIVTAFSRLEELGITDWSKFPNQRNLGTNTEFRSIALRGDSRYEEIYKCGLRLSHYNFMLEDYSFFQFSKDNNTPQYRYSFYANPYEIPSTVLEFSAQAQLEEEELETSEIYMQELDEALVTNITPPIRYDYDLNSYFPLRHPAGHLHIGIFQGSRLPVRRLLTPECFALFVVKHFYASEWAKFDEAPKGKDAFFNPFDEHLANSKNGCVLVDDDFFSDLETQLPFID